MAGIHAVAIEKLAASRGMQSYRVAYKQNARGEHVVAIIWQSQVG